MRKHFTLMLVFLLLLGMTASAASTLYYAQDFNYTLASEIAKDALTDGTAVFDHTKNPNYAVATWRNSGKNIVVPNGNPTHDTHAEITKNGDGNNSYGIKTYGTKYISFIPEEQWDGKTKSTETYVVSLDIYPKGIKTSPYFMALYGYRGNAETPVYNRARIMNEHTSYGGLITTTAQYSGTGLGLTAGGETKRVAQAFKYDATATQLKRDVVVDGVVKGTGITFELENMTTVDGIGFGIDGSGHPYIGKIRMYTIDNAEGFKVTAIDSGDVSPLGPKVTLKFNRPILSINKNQISVKKGSEDITKFTVSEPKTVINGTEIYSTVDIKFTATLEADEDYSIIFNDTVTDEIGNKIVSPNNKVDFHTQDYPVFETNTSVKDLGNGVNISELVDKNVTFNSAFKNTSSSSVDAVIFVGIYSFGTDGEKETADDKLVGYSLAKTSIASNSEQSISFGTKVEAGTYVKALSFSFLEDLANPDINFSEGNPVID